MLFGRTLHMSYKNNLRKSSAEMKSLMKPSSQQNWELICIILHPSNNSSVAGAANNISTQIKPNKKRSIALIKMYPKFLLYLSHTEKMKMKICFQKIKFGSKMKKDFEIWIH